MKPSTWRHSRIEFKLHGVSAAALLALLFLLPVTGISNAETQYFPDGTYTPGDISNSTIVVDDNSTVIFIGGGNITNCTLLLNASSELQIVNGTYSLVNTSVIAPSGGALSVQNASLVWIGTLSNITLRASDANVTGSLDNVIFTGTNGSYELNQVNNSILELRNSTVALNNTFNSTVELWNCTLLSPANNITLGNATLAIWQPFKLHIETNARTWNGSVDVNVSGGPYFAEGGTIWLQTAIANDTGIHERDYLVTVHSVGLSPFSTVLNSTSAPVVNAFLVAARASLNITVPVIPYETENFTASVEVTSHDYWFNGTVSLAGEKRNVSVPPEGSLIEGFVLTAPAGEDSMALTVSLDDWPLSNAPVVETITVPVLPRPAVSLHLPAVAVAGNEVTAYVLGSYRDMEFRFDFGDGNITDWSPATEARHAYVMEGNYTVTVVGRVPGRVESEPVQASIVINQPQVANITVAWGNGTEYPDAGEAVNVVVYTFTEIVINASPAIPIYVDGTEYTGSVVLNYSVPGTHSVVIDTGPQTLLIVEILNRPPALNASVSTYPGGAHFSAVPEDPEGGPVYVFWSVKSDHYAINFTGTSVDWDLPAGKYTYEAYSCDSYGGCSSVITGTFNVTVDIPLDISLAYPKLNVTPIKGGYNITYRENLTLVLVAITDADQVVWLNGEEFMGRGPTLVLPVENNTSWINLTVVAIKGTAEKHGFLNMSIYHMPALPVDIDNRTGNPTGSKKEATGSYWWVAIVVILLIVALGTFLAVRGVIPLPQGLAALIKGGRWGDVDSNSFGRTDLVILKKGDRDMIKHELLQASADTPEGRATVYAWREFVSPNGEAWDMKKEMRSDDMDGILMSIRSTIDRDLKRGYEIYVQGYGRILSSRGTKNTPEKGEE